MNSAGISPILQCIRLRGDREIHGTGAGAFHDLRHSYAVVSLESGDDIKTVQTNLGHATASFTLDVYGHISQKMRQQSADRMEQVYPESIRVSIHRRLLKNLVRVSVRVKEHEKTL